VFLDRVTVCHPGDVIADGSFQPTDGYEFLVGSRQDGGLFLESAEQVSDNPLGFNLHAYDAEMTVKVVVEKILQFPVAALHVLAVADDVVLELLELERGFRLALLEPPISGMDDVGHEQPHQVADHAVAFHVVEGGAMPVECFLEDLPQGDTFQHVRIDQAGAQAVIQVVGGVSQLIRHIGDLRLEVAAQGRVEVAGVRDVIFRFVLDDALARLPGQVETGEFRVTLFEFGDDAQRLFVVVETTRILH